MRSRDLVAHPASRRPLHDDIAALRRKATRRYVEMDLLVAALNDHVRDLRVQRDRLAHDLQQTRADLGRMREQADRLTDAWFLHGHKTVRRPG